MDKFDRIYALHRIFSARRYPVPMDVLCGELECSTSTLKRVIREMGEQLGAPIFNVRGKGWRYDPTKIFELPGLWFNRSELEALLAMQHLLSHIGPGLLAEELQPVQERLTALLSKMSPNAAGEVGRIRILDMHNRKAMLPHFPLVTAAVLERERLVFDYESRSLAASVRREVSPQRLVHYRDNWYLDAFCHEREALRTFSLDRMTRVIRVDEAAIRISEKELENKLGSAYGIFSGRADKIAVLRFTPERARWIADEEWHPQQQGKWLDDGYYELSLPYGSDTELILDICRYGPDVEVIAPPGLRSEIAGRLREAAGRYA